MTSDQEKLRPIRRMLTGVLAFQLVLAGVLFLGDIGRDFALPSTGPRAPRFDMPTQPGDQTRRYDPSLPTAPGTQIDGPMPERLVLQPLDDGRALLTGQIERGDGERIAARIAASEASEIVLHSPGGAVADALEVGRALRTAGLTTRLRARDVCLSACPYILAAGTERQVDEGGRVGVHQHYYGENTLLPAFLAVQDIQRGQGEVMRYLDEMGVDPMLLTHGLSTPPQSIYLMTREELERYDLVTP
ncbi:hypothetical protein OB2597_02042 [Pseudooceanicola batsensis HTCC2597]|uniref:Periplasmic protein n=1 Tax=Pseudooceanicola batsensis (strain ATCC BAA-863 / DSM 15984 / KCTC 12145 / HTCC2597) TaxID=252305 RepID=A3TX02_PSEBH|nr:hypothetical protein [Pseudooceanicola batsensis]EAQ03362.1 hypothetical protein OB2597_02042 [Pseudooceanicola batsensis HTCC2597]